MVSLFLFVTHTSCKFKIHHLKAQLALRNEEATAEAAALQQQTLKQAEEVRPKG